MLFARFRQQTCQWSGGILRVVSHWKCIYILYVCFLVCFLFFIPYLSYLSVFMAVDYTAAAKYFLHTQKSMKVIGLN